jgi:Derlin-2/3
MFLGGFSFPFVMQCYLFTNFGGKLERNARFSAVPGEYLYFLFVVITLVSVFSLLLAWPRGYPLTGPAVIFSIIYYWSRCEPEARLSFFGFELKGSQLPFGMVFFTMIIGGDVWTDLLGLAAGHLYYFLKDVVPGEYRVQLISTPGIIQRLVKKLDTSAPAPAVPNHTPWGGGHRLGRRD